ncbi:MAG: hypothetical protein PVJ38_08740, partial [Candidatus Bathyarchaeota archaeon]
NKAQTENIHNNVSLADDHFLYNLCGKKLSIQNIIVSHTMAVSVHIIMLPTYKQRFIHLEDERTTLMV